MTKQLNGWMASIQHESHQRRERRTRKKTFTQEFIEMTEKGKKWKKQFILQTLSEGEVNTVLNHSLTH